MTNLEKIDMWSRPATVEPNNFKFKSLSNWSVNISVGCSHGCRFCYVPETSTNKQAESLKNYGVQDPDAEWGDYSLLRTWDADKFHASLNKAAKTPDKDLKRDGNRAIMYCTTTDPYQTFKASFAARTTELMSRAEQMVRNSLEIIRDDSDLNVRILTRSPLAKRHFDLFKSFGDRLVFGMSLPTMNDKLCRVYEPNAPGPNARLKMLQEARGAGLNVFVAMASTYPECDENDLRETLKCIKQVEPITLYHEPINIRADNVARIKGYGEVEQVAMKTDLLAQDDSWFGYALGQLLQIQKLATELGMQGCLHLWPDQGLKNKPRFLRVRSKVWEKADLPEVQRIHRKIQDETYYNTLYLPWLEQWWSRVSEWPGQKRDDSWECPMLINPFK